MKNIASIFCLSIVLILCTNTGKSRANQTIYGRVLKKSTHTPVEAAHIVVLGADPTRAVTSNKNGRYRLAHVPAGLTNILIFKGGFYHNIVKGLIVKSGKETHLTVFLEKKARFTEEHFSMSEFSLPDVPMPPVKKSTGHINSPYQLKASDMYPFQYLNQNIPVSFSGLGFPIIASRYSLNNPKPKLRNNQFSKIIESGDKTWHNASINTGIIPVHYNITPGAEIKHYTKSTPPQNSQFHISAGSNIMKFQAEMPFGTQNTNTVLLDYRRSTADLIANTYKYPLTETNNFPGLQDILLKTHINTSDIGTIDITAEGGTKNITYAGDSILPFGYSGVFPGIVHNIGNKNGSIVLNHHYPFSQKSRLKTSVSIKAASHQKKVTSPTSDYKQASYPYANFDLNTITYNLSSIYRFHPNSHNSFKFGIKGILTDITLKDSTFTPHISQNFSEKFWMPELFSSWTHSFSNFVKLYTGLRVRFLPINNHYTIAPRSLVTFNMQKNQKVTFGFGSHTQLPPKHLYFYEKRKQPDKTTRSNTEMDFMKNYHYHLGYTIDILRHLNLSTKLWYNENADLIRGDTSEVCNSYNVPESLACQPIDDLKNSGKSKNYGISVTLEREVKNNYRFLLSGSLYDAWGIDKNGNKENIRLNQNYALKGNFSYFLPLSKKYHIQFNMNAQWYGGLRVLPINKSQSSHNGYTTYNTKHAYTNKHPGWLTTHFSLKFTINAQKISHSLSLQIQNIPGRQNTVHHYFNEASGEKTQIKRSGFFPAFNYAINF